MDRPGHRRRGELLDLARVDHLRARVPCGEERVEFERTEPGFDVEDVALLAVEIRVVAEVLGGSGWSAVTNATNSSCDIGCSA